VPSAANFAASSLSTWIEDTRRNSSQPFLPLPLQTARSAKCSRLNSGRSGIYPAGVNAAPDYINGEYTKTNLIIIMKKSIVLSLNKIIINLSLIFFALSALIL
jgi:hypothetical protein